MKIYKRYEYLGPRGLRWTDWFSIKEVETEEEAKEYIGKETKSHAGRREEYKIV